MGAAQNIVSTPLVAGACLAGSPALVEKRVALVIGNSAYQKVAPLSNPANDTGAVAAMLKQAGFDSVDSKMGLKGTDMRRALREFGNMTRDADAAVIYYAGHGIRVHNTNYLDRVPETVEIAVAPIEEPAGRECFDPRRRLALVVDPQKHVDFINWDFQKGEWM
jgi:hypothetical protein